MPISNDKEQKVYIDRKKQKQTTIPKVERKKCHVTIQT